MNVKTTFIQRYMDVMNVRWMLLKQRFVPAGNHAIKSLQKSPLKVLNSYQFHCNVCQYMEENNEDIRMFWSNDSVNKYFHVRITMDFPCKDSEHKNNKSSGNLNNKM